MTSKGSLYRSLDTYKNLREIKIPLFLHISEPAYQPLNGFEPMEEMEDPLGDPYADIRGELKDHHADMQKFF